MAGQSEIPAIIRPVKDEELLELALIENIQRAQLNPVERARAYKQLHDKYQLSPEEIGKRMGEDRATVSNYLRMLSLCEFALDLVEAGELGTGHARALLGIQDEKVVISLVSRIVREGWSVRAVEAAVAKIKQSKPPVDIQKTARPAVRDVEDRLRASLGMRIAIREGRRRHSGRLVIEYQTLNEFERIVGLLGVAPESP